MKHHRDSSVFIAGGIGITPFRSIVIDHVLRQKPLSAVLFHFAASEKEFLFREEFEKAEQSVGLRYIPLIRKRDQELVSTLLTGYIVTPHLHQYYIAGSSTFILSIQSILQSLEIDPEQIQTDIFSGYLP